MRRGSARCAASAVLLAVFEIVAFHGLVAPAHASDQLAPLWRQVFERPATSVPSEGSDLVAVEPESAAGLVALGETLFSDTRLSGDGTRSCATCHVPSLGFADGLERASGRSPTALLRNTPTLWGIGFQQAVGSSGRKPRLNWDGSASNLIEQMQRPITDLQELASAWPGIVERLHSDDQIRQIAASTGPGVVDRGFVESAIAAYVARLAPPRTRFDDWIAGDDDALTDVEKAGFALFAGKGRCATCHIGWRMTDDRLRDIGRAPEARTGRVRFKTPTLRSIIETAPYMHDGALATLDDVVGHYAGGVISRPSLSETIAPDLALAPHERAALVAFLKTL
ncbi:MAG: cytochrome-c peroxidase [Hyphomicrobiaceae bacterium]